MSGIVRQALYSDGVQIAAPRRACVPPPEVRRRYGPCLACRSPRVRGAHASVAVAPFGVAGGTYRGRHKEYFRTHLPAATRDWAGQCGRDRGSLALTGPGDRRLLRCRSRAAALTRRVIGGPGGPVENASVSIVVLKCVLKRPQKSPGLPLHRVRVQETTEISRQHAHPSGTLPVRQTETGLWPETGGAKTAVYGTGRAQPKGQNRSRPS
jgi:hypothetical protein